MIVDPRRDKVIPAPALAVSTPSNRRVCLVLPPDRTRYCGRLSSMGGSPDLERVTCADCLAAYRADQSVKEPANGEA